MPFFKGTLIVIVACFAMPFIWLIRFVYWIYECGKDVYDWVRYNYNKTCTQN